MILVGGALCDRHALRPLADELAGDFDVVTYDRRGRGDSGDSTPYAVQREVDDIAALLTELGGTAAIYGHSSGAGLAAIAASWGCRSPRSCCTSCRTGRMTWTRTRTASRCSSY